MTVSIARCQAELWAQRRGGVDTTRPLIGLLGAAKPGAAHQLGDSERHGNEHGHGECVPREGALIAKASRTPSTTANQRWIAARTDDRTETWTTTRAVSGASTGSGTPVTTSAIHHDRPAANPDLATTPISVDVGRVHETAWTTRCHNSSTRPAVGGVADDGSRLSFRHWAAYGPESAAQAAQIAAGTASGPSAAW